MEVYKNRFHDLETLSASEQRKLDSQDIFVFDGTNNVRLSDLYVLESIAGKSIVRKVRGLADFQRNIKKHNNIFSSEEALLSTHIDAMVATLKYERFEVPEILESTSLDKTDATEDEKIPYGLKRTLEVSKTEAGEGEYLYAFVDGKGEFISKSEIFWYDGLSKKTYEDAISEGKNLEEIQFVDKFNRDISAVYTEYEYKFGRILASEKANLTSSKKDSLPAYTTLTYVTDSKGNAMFTQSPIEKVVSEQEFVTKEIEVDYNKKKKVSRVKTKNYALSRDGQFIAITVNGQVKMVDRESLTDTDGNEIANLASMVGKNVNIVEDGAIVATSEPLTYVQANTTYDSRKVYQETSAEPSETSCLKLADGSFVKELESVQPISYQLAEDDAANFDKYLVPQQVGDKTIYVVVDKNILRSSVSASGLDLSNAKKLIRCDFNSKNCAVVQKTSKGRLIEECALVKKIKFGDELVDVSENKAELYNSFKEDYKKGEYKVDDVYLAGDKRELDSGDKRYEFTDETYHDDYAENLHAYKSLKTKNITIKDGKIEGGAKFSVGKGIAESYRVWGKALLAGVTLVPWLAVFGPIGVVAVAAYDVGVLAAAPLIPAVNAGIGIVRNNPMRKVLKYKDKTEHNRNKQASEIQTKLNELFANKTLSANDFDNALANIMNKIEMFAQTTSNNSLVVVDGKAEVNPNNANLANQYVADYKKAKKSYEAYKRKVDALIAAGKPVPADLQEKFRQSEAEFEALKNTTRGQDYSHDARLELLQNKAAAIRLCRCIESYPDSELVRGLSDELKSKLSYDAAHGLKIAGLSIDANENQIKRKFKKIDADILAWKALREEALKAVEQAKEIKSKEPKSENVESILSSALEEENVLNNALQQMNELINACEASYGSIDAILAEISDKYAIKGKLKSRADSIWEAVKNLRNNTEGLTLTKVEKRIEKINQKVEDLKEMETEANTAKTLTNSIETEIGEFSVIHERIKSICSSLGGDEKEQNLKEVEGYVESTLNAYKAAQKDKTTANLEVQLNNILANKEKANTLYETIIELDKEATKNAMIEEVGKSYQEAVRLITLLDETEIKSIFGSFVSTLTNAKRLIKKFENNIKLDESTIKDAVTAKNKAGIVVQLIDFGVKSLMVMELVRKTYGAEEQSRVGRIIGEMAQYMIVSEETTIGMLNDNLNNAKSKYERELLPYLTNVEKKDEKKDEEPKKLPKEKKNKVEQPKVKEEPKTDMVRLAGEKQIRDKLNTLLSDKNSWTEEDEHIHSLLLTATKLSEKELNKKMASIALKLTQNLNETKNTKFSKGYLPYVIVETIAEELHLDKKMFDIDPNQYSMLDINNDQNPTLFVE